MRPRRDAQLEEIEARVVALTVGVAAIDDGEFEDSVDAIVRASDCTGRDPTAAFEAAVCQDDRRPLPDLSAELAAFRERFEAG